jgi:2-(3-amino-3-carboxypropyl)histidine synthase
MLEIKLDNAIVELKKMSAKRILLQIPEGLKVKSGEIISNLENAGFDVITSMDPCFGACDVKVNEAKQMNCDAILHLGHNAFVENTEKIVYEPMHYYLKNFEKIMEKLYKYLKEKNVKKAGFVTTAQFLDYVNEAKNFFQKKNIELITQNGIRTVEAQVLGCNYSSVPVEDTVIYFGDGLFHPLGIHFATQKNVIIVDPINEEIKELGKEKDVFLRKRILMIEKAREAKNFGIIVSTKQGQNRISVAKKIKEELEKKGKSARIYSMDYIDSAKLLGTKEEAYISTACPRIAIDDFASFKKPIINAFEVKYLLSGNYDKYKIDLYY